MAQKTITFDRDTRDFLLELDGEFIGYAASHDEGEKILDALVYERARRQSFADVIEPETLAMPIRQPVTEEQSLNVQAAAAGYRYVRTLYDRITVRGELRLTRYHAFEPINPTPFQGNAYVPFVSPHPGSWGDAQDCDGRLLASPACHAVATPEPEPEPSAPAAAALVAPARLAPPAIIADAASVLYARYAHLADAPRERYYRAITKAFTQLIDGCLPRREGNALIFRSRSRARTGLTYRVVEDVCSCEATSVCWHLMGAELAELIADAESEQADLYAYEYAA